MAAVATAFTPGHTSRALRAQPTSVFLVTLALAAARAATPPGLPVVVNAGAPASGDVVQFNASLSVSVNGCTAAGINVGWSGTLVSPVLNAYNFTCASVKQPAASSNGGILFDVTNLDAARTVVLTGLAQPFPSAFPTCSASASSGGPFTQANAAPGLPWYSGGPTCSTTSFSVAVLYRRLNASAPYCTGARALRCNACSRRLR